MGPLRIMENRIVGPPSTIYIDPKIDPPSKRVGTGKILTTLEFVMLDPGGQRPIDLLDTSKSETQPRPSIQVAEATCGDRIAQVWLQAILIVRADE